MVGIVLALYGDKVSIASAVFISMFAMIVVFLVLLIISYMIDATAFFINRKQKKVQVDKGNPEVTKVVEIKTTDDSALVATIAAVVASYMNANVDDIVIKKIRRVK